MDISDYGKLNMEDYGFVPSMMPENASGIPARVTTVHKESMSLFVNMDIFLADLNQAYITLGD